MVEDVNEVLPGFCTRKNMNRIDIEKKYNFFITNKLESFIFIYFFL